MLYCSVLLNSPQADDYWFVQWALIPQIISLPKAAPSQLFYSLKTAVSNVNTNCLLSVSTAGSDVNASFICADQA